MSGQWNRKEAGSLFMGGKHPPEGMVVIWERVCLPTRSSTGLSAKSVRAPLRYVEALRCLPRCLVKLASGGAGSHGGLPRIVVPLESVVCPCNGVARRRFILHRGKRPSEGMAVIWERVCLPTRSRTGLSAKSVRAPLRYAKALRGVSIEGGTVWRAGEPAPPPASLS